MSLPGFHPHPADVTAEFASVERSPDHLFPGARGGHSTMSYTIRVVDQTRVPHKRGWAVHVYRETDDEHIHSADPTPLTTGLHEAEAAIIEDATRNECG